MADHSMLNFLGPLLVLTFLTLCFAALKQKAIFGFSYPSEVLNSSGSRIHGARNKIFKDFVICGLFPNHTSADGGVTCRLVGLERGLEKMDGMLYAIDDIYANDHLLKGLILGYDIRDACSSPNIGLGED